MKEYPLFGALDIGSNAARILFANVIQHINELVVFKNSLLRLPLRLGEDVYDTGKLSPRKTNSIIETLRVFSSLIKIYKPLDYAVYATAAIREATNSQQVLGLLKAESGFQIHVIDGLEEARIIKELYQNKGGNENFKLMADLGGGSFELTVLSPSGKYISDSFKIGAVRALNSSIPDNEFDRMYKWLETHLPEDRKNVYFIGTGGNMNTMKSTFSSVLTDYLELKKIKEILNQLKPLSVRDRISTYRLRPDRADVIIPAAEIFINMMEYCKIDKVHIPGGGLSDGIVLELYKKHFV